MIVLELGPDASAPRIAREAVHDALAGYSVDARDVAVLLVDELVTNALVHGHGQIGLRVEDSPDWIRVRVSDSDSSLPTPPAPEPRRRARARVDDRRCPGVCVGCRPDPEREDHLVPVGSRLAGPLGAAHHQAVRHPQALLRNHPRREPCSIPAIP